MRTHIDLFSGIGGFALAAKWNGFETVQFCEREPYCQKLLAQHWPGVSICDDIHNLKGEYCDLLTGGFPCQPYSLAGKRRGAADDRALWPEMLRVIKEGRPRWVVGENVSGFVKMGLDQAIFDLEAVGYSCWSFIVPAVGVDARHNRDRVWIVAHSNCIDGRPGARGENGSEAGDCSKDVADTYSDDVQGVVRKFTDKEEWAVTGKRSAGSLRDGCRGFWPAEPGMGRVAHGVSNRVDRIKGLGNAIVPQVASEIIRCIVETEKQ